jgi:hypothetical protein
MSTKQDAAPIVGIGVAACAVRPVTESVVEMSPTRVHAPG